MSGTDLGALRSQYSPLDLEKHVLPPAARDARAEAVPSSGLFLWVQDHAIPGRTVDSGDSAGSGFICVACQAYQELPELHDRF